MMRRLSYGMRRWILRWTSAGDVGLPPPKRWRPVVAGWWPSLGSPALRAARSVAGWRNCAARRSLRRCRVGCAGRAPDARPSWTPIRRCSAISPPWWSRRRGAIPWRRCCGPPRACAIWRPNFEVSVCWGRAGRIQVSSVYLKSYADGREAKAGNALWIAFYNGRRPNIAPPFQIRSATGQHRRHGGVSGGGKGRGQGL